MIDTIKELDDAYIQAETDLVENIDNDMVVMGVLLILLGRIHKILASNGIQHPVP